MSLSKKRKTSKDYREKYKSDIASEIHSKKLLYKIPTNPNQRNVPEKVLSWIISCAITQKFAIKTLEEFYLTKSSRIDIYIPSHQIGVEVKIDGRRSSGSRVGETPAQQLARYKKSKKIKKAYLVSIDGSIGYNIDSLLRQLEGDLKS